MMSIRKYLVIWLLLLGSQLLPVSVGRVSLHHSKYICPRCTIFSLYCTQGYHLLITSLTSSSDPNYANVTVTAPRSLINASIESTTTLRKIDLYFRLDIRYSMAEPYRTLINRTIDLCEFFKNPQKDPLTALFFDAIPTNNCNNHIFRACPIKAVL